MGLFSNEDIGLQPNKDALRVVVVADASPRSPFRTCVGERRGGHEIGERTPGAAWPRIERARDLGDLIDEIGLGQEAAARREDVPIISREPLEDPKEVADDWLLIIGQGHPRRPAVLPVP